MRKVLSVVLIFIMAISFAACDSSYAVEGEKNAIKIYKCSNKNILGLQKIVIFDDHVVAVYDRKAPRSEYSINIDNIIQKQNLSASATLTGNSDYQCTSKYETNAEVFVVTLYLSSSSGDSKVIKPEQGSDVSYITIENYSVSMNGGYLKISFKDHAGTLRYQDYSPVTTNWSGVKQQAG